MQMMLHQAVPFVMCVLRLAKKMQIMVADSRPSRCHTVRLDLPRRGLGNLDRGGAGAAATAAVVGGGSSARKPAHRALLFTYGPRNDALGVTTRQKSPDTVKATMFAS